MQALSDAACDAAIRVCSDERDDEAVHDFRVALRRMRSIVRASRRLYGSRMCRKWEAKLKRFGDATNALRDAEVLADTLRAAELQGIADDAAQKWVAAQRKRRSALHQAAVTMLLSGNHSAMLKRLLKRMAQEPKRDLELLAYADDSIAQARQDVEALLPVPADDVDRLHRLRIRFKRLRYNAEMLRGAWTPRKARAIGRACLGQARMRQFRVIAEASSKLQRQLGMLHDADQALLALEGNSGLPGDGRDAIEQGLLELRTKLVKRALSSMQELPAEVRP